MNSCKRHNNRAFTLIELLVVIAIVGLLSAVVIVGIKATREKARDTEKISNIHQIQKGLAAYYLGEGDGIKITTSSYAWDTSREPASPSWEWMSWSDTPCNAACTGPTVLCLDHSTSNPDSFLEQLVRTGWFTREQIIRMTSETPDKLMIYRYSCDLQSYTLKTRLSDGSFYEVQSN